MSICGARRRSRGIVHDCRLERGHDPHTRPHVCSTCGIGHAPGNENFTLVNKNTAIRLHHEEARKQTTLRVLRERAGLTQGELARKVERKQPDVSAWEWRKVSIPQDIRYRLTGLLKAYLPKDTVVLEPDDLSRPWDEVREEWKRRARHA